MKQFCTQNLKFLLEKKNRRREVVWVYGATFWLDVFYEQEIKYERNDKKSNIQLIFLILG